jgi:hypothetical protein
MVPTSDEENSYVLHLRELEIWMSLAYGHQQEIITDVWSTVGAKHALSIPQTCNYTLCF